jgi:hypothetical protein
MKPATRRLSTTELVHDSSLNHKSATGSSDIGLSATELSARCRLAPDDRDRDEILVGRSVDALGATPSSGSGAIAAAVEAFGLDLL